MEVRLEKSIINELSNNTHGVIIRIPEDTAYAEIHALVVCPDTGETGKCVLKLGPVELFDARNDFLRSVAAGDDYDDVL